MKFSLLSRVVNLNPTISEFDLITDTIKLLKLSSSMRFLPNAQIVWSNEKAYDLHIEPRPSEALCEASGKKPWEIDDLFVSINKVNKSVSMRIDIESLKHFIALLPKGLVTEEELLAIKVLYDKIHAVIEPLSSAHHKIACEALQQKLITPTTLKQLYEASEALYCKIATEDIVIFVGNTPQLLRYTLEKIHPDVKQNQGKIISLGISGTPDLIKDGYSNYLLEAIVTEKGHESYKEYMQSMGLIESNIVSHKIHFIDYVGAGGGILYLMNAISEIAFKGNMEAAKSHFKVTGLHESSMRLIPDDIATIDHLDAEYLGRVLDSASNEGEDRLMIKSSAYKWDNSNFFKQLTYNSNHIFDNPNSFFQPVFCEIDKYVDIQQQAQAVTPTCLPFSSEIIGDVIALDS